MDFRKCKGVHEPISINGEDVKIVDTFKFLGIWISANLDWSEHITHCVKKGQQRLYVLRSLRTFSVGRAVLIKFYRAVIESVLTLSITVWYGNGTVADRRRLQQVVKSASYIIGIKLPSIEKLYRKRCLTRARAIMKDESHPAHGYFEYLPSSRRLRAPVST